MRDLGSAQSSGALQFNVYPPPSSASIIFSKKLSLAHGSTSAMHIWLPCTWRSVSQRYCLQLSMALAPPKELRWTHGHTELGY